MSEEARDPLAGFRGREIPADERALLEEMEFMGLDTDAQNKLQRGEVINQFLTTLVGQELIKQVRQKEKDFLTAVQQYPEVAWGEVERLMWEYKTGCHGLVQMNKMVMDAQAVITNIEEEELGGSANLFDLTGE